MKLLEYIGEQIDKYSWEILKFTPQLFIKKPAQTSLVVPDPNASGVLLNILENYFLITAGHVIENNDPENIGIMIKDKFFILNGIIKYVKPTESEQADKIDIAIWKLDNQVASDLKEKYSFLPLDKIDINHKLDSEPRYLILGYPWKNTKLDKVKMKIIGPPLTFLSNLSNPNEYKRLKYESHSNLLLNYRQKKVRNFKSGTIQQNVSPEGISGCGVWYIPHFLTQPYITPEFKLVGQIIEQNKEKTILIATRIHIVTEVIRRDFGINLPRSLITKLK